MLTSSVANGPGDHSGLIGAGSLAHSLLTGIDLSGARLEPLELTDVTLDRANLSNAMLLRTTARRVDLLGCQATGLQLGLEQGNDVYAENYSFDHATIRIDKIRGATMFAGDLSRVRFLHRKLAAAEFEAIGATDCDLRSSRLGNIRGLGNLRGATITTEQAPLRGRPVIDQATRSRWRVRSPAAHWTGPAFPSRLGRTARLSSTVS